MRETPHALVCGASSGIGRAVASLLASRCCRVTALARRAAVLEELVTELSASGAPEPASLPADLDDRDALVPAVEALVRERGPVHILVNNAGGPPPGRLLDAGPEELLAGFGRHVLASHALVRALVPGMEEEGYGRIVNVVSISVREPIPGLGVSNTIRAAMAGWAKTLSGELPPGVTVNNVLPGYTDTERLRSLSASLAAERDCPREEVVRTWISEVPEGRLARPVEVAAAVAFLCSPEAGYVRGQSLAVDGGRLRSI